MSLPLPKGYSFSCVDAGFHKKNRTNLALVVSETDAVAAGVFTTNLFRAAPVLVAEEHLRAKASARGIVVNAACANACTGDEGVRNCLRSLELVAKATGLAVNDLLPASTGVIGTQLRMDLWEKAAPVLASELGKHSALDFAAAIMTTDAFPKHAGREVRLSGGIVHLCGMAKGAGMICPNMATMISVVLCDAVVSPGLWQGMFTRAAAQSFNRVSVDGDTSTNDSLFGLSNGASGVALTTADTALLEQELVALLTELALLLVRDGEGATKIIHITVTGAATEKDAEQVARTVGHSPLVKTAMYGKDANWGRIVAAAGRSGVKFVPERLRLCFCGVELFVHGQPVADNFDEQLREPLAGDQVTIHLDLGSGTASYDFYASDLTHAYIDCNANYRS